MTQVFLHGAGLNAEIWGEVPGKALNLPGHGGRARARRATAEEFAEDAMEYDDEALELDALKAERDEV